MNQKIEPLLLDMLADPNKIIDVIVIATKPSAIEEVGKFETLHVTQVIRFINAIAGRIQAKHLISLSESPAVRWIELNKEVSITA